MGPLPELWRLACQRWVWVSVSHRITSESSPSAPIEDMPHDPARRCANPSWYVHSIRKTSTLSIKTTSDPFALDSGAVLTGNFEWIRAVWLAAVESVLI